MGLLGPGYRSLARIRQEELREEREAGSLEAADPLASLDEDMVAQRAARRRLERGAARAMAEGGPGFAGEGAAGEADAGGPADAGRPRDRNDDTRRRTARP